MSIQSAAGLAGERGAVKHQQDSGTGEATRDLAEIGRAVAILMEPGGVVELRALHAQLEREWKTGTLSGYFSSPDELGEAVQAIAFAKGVYITLNPPSPALLARADNRLRLVGKGEPLTADHDILKRRWLPIDADPRRPSGISSSEVEHRAAIERTTKIRDFLRSLGWPEPLMADSGNGGHLLYRIDLPAADDGLVQRCLEVLAARFDDDVVKLDTSVFNPSRIWKLYGTEARKGDDTVDRPHRLARLLEVPVEVVPVTSSQLLALAGPAHATTLSLKTGSRTASKNGEFDLAAWIAQHLADANGPKAWKGTGVMWTLPICPFNADHVGGSAFVGQQPEGPIVAGCHHNSCTWDWKDLRDKLEPARQRTQAKKPRRVREDDEVEVARPTREELLAATDAAVEEALASTPADARAEAEDMLLDPLLIDRVLADIQAIGVVGEEELAATCYLLGTSRLLPKPLAAVVQGHSTTGKSFVPLTTAQLFPPEAVVNATDLTTNALYYLEPGTLIHRWIVAGEQRRGEDDQQGDARKALREMLESGRLSKMVTVKIKGGMKAVLIDQPGPIAFIESTTKVKLFDEDANRCLLLGTDESEDQTRRIVLSQAARAAGKLRDPRPVIARHHALQRMLRRVEVVIPFAENLAAAVPVARPEARRAVPHMLSMIRAVTLLHQRQRAAGTIRHGDVIYSEVTDYVIARKLLIGPLGRALGGSLPEAVVRFGERLNVSYGSRPYTASEVLRDDAILNSKGKVSEYLRALEGAGAAECIEEARGNKPARWRMIGSVPTGAALWLPTVRDITGERP